MDKDNKIISLDNDKLNKAIEENKTPAEVPEEVKEDTREATEEIKDNLPRLEDGSIDIEAISIGKDDKGRYIVPDEIFDKCYKELPNGTGNESKTYKAFNKGKIKCLTANDKDIQRMGANALNAKLSQRRTFAEAIKTVLAQKPTEKVREELELDSSADNLDAVIAAMLRQAQRGNVKAGDFLRDTVGEKPTDKLEASVETMTAEDREMLANIQKRMEENG